MIQEVKLENITKQIGTNYNLGEYLPYDEVWTDLWNYRKKMALEKQC